MGEVVAVEEFEKILTPTEINFRRLFYPTGKLHLLPFREGRREVDFDVYYGDSVDAGSRYVFRCIKRPGAYDKPTISTGWSDLVRDKDLQVGDKLKFFKEHNHLLPYYVQAYRLINGTWSLLP